MSEMATATDRDPLLTSKEAANHLGYSEETLRDSRTSGRLSGVDAPPHIKLGTRSVRYRLSAVEGWIAQFEK